jgi:FkbH-like protein/FkbM family methyltransferase
MPRDVNAVMRHVTTLYSPRPGEACAELRVGVQSAPYLADHGFQGMVVLPGSFYIEMARCLDRELSESVPAVVRNVTFHRPIILTADDTGIRVDVCDRGDGHVQYRFSEMGVEDDGSRPSTDQYAASLTVDRSTASSGSDAEPLSIEAFQAQSHAVIDGDRFYKKLRDNGNQYGPGFQRVRSMWRAGDQTLGKLSVARQNDTAELAGLHPSVLDAVTQLLASFVIDHGKTFILRSIGKVDVMHDVDASEELWGHAVLRPEGDEASEAFVGSVRVFDSSGKEYLRLSGAAFAFLDRPDDAAEDEAAHHVVVAANFTAEPIEASLKFWGDQFGVPVHLEFAPYDQIFQQLLDTGSALRRNRDGFNVILLGLEEWSAADGPTGMTLSEERAEQCFGDRSRYVLPNGLEIAHLNRYETDYLYKEIFEDQTYLKHGIQLRDGATVVDIGANIGLFSLFVMRRCENPTIYAFEPAPAVYELLKANCEAYGSNVYVRNVGVSDKSKLATFTFYEHSSVFSGFHTDETEDRAAIQTVVRNTLRSETEAIDVAVDEYVTELTADRLRRTTHECRVMSVSDIIREHGIDKIDLLKVDAERSELDILEGIDERHWPKIAQIVMEIHDRTQEAVQQVQELLTAKGYRCVVERERLLEDSGLFNLYATRGETASASAPLSRPRRVLGRLQRTIQDLRVALEGVATHGSAPVILCVSPRTPAVEADADLKAALSDAEERLLSDVSTIPNVHPISSASLLERYPVEDYYDQHGHQLGSIPYTSECYAAIGTALFRTAFSLKRTPFKVIVLDCDNTLWKGVCGEDGHLGVEVSGPYRRLQEFMVRRKHAGMLLCLCSKNHEQDVLEVFDRRTDMVLKREDLASWRINWSRKSDNIKALAQELGLGLDSFIFIDDNPVDCADVRIHCPGVLTLQLPSDSASFPAFLDHVWAFDHAGATEEDRSRTRMYRENAQRQRFREQVGSLGDFIKGLELDVEVSEATDDQLRRVSQLTFRTNQFNLTTVRRSEQEIRAFIERDVTECLVIRVADRFGDYGIVGVVLYETTTDRFTVDTLLLSCRVLGRGVEHAVVARLAQRARERGKRFVDLVYRRTDRNTPARAFLETIGARELSEPEASLSLEADHLARLVYEPDRAAQRGQEAPEAPDSHTRAHRAGSRFGKRGLSEVMQWIATDLRDVGHVAQAIEQYRLRSERRQDHVDGTPVGTLEAELLSIWRKVLGRSRIGPNDNFFEVGGTSLRAVQVIAMIKKELNQHLSIVSLFECPTVALLAARLRAASGESTTATTSRAAQRGRRRRRVVRREAS